MLPCKVAPAAVELLTVSLWLCRNTIFAPVASATDAIQAVPVASITQD